MKLIAVLMALVVALLVAAFGANLQVTVRQFVGDLRAMLMFDSLAVMLGATRAAVFVGTGGSFIVSTDKASRRKR